MSRTQKAINGLAADLIGQIISQLLMFVAIPVYLFYLSNVAYGFWLTIGSIVMWISLSDLGIGMALGRILIKLQATETAQKLYNERNSLVNTAVIIFLGCAAVFFIVGFILYPFAVNWFKVDDANYHVFKLTYFLSITAGAISLPSSVFAGILESNQRLALNRNLSTLGTILNVLISIVLVYYFKSIVALAYSLLLSVLIRTVISWYFANQTVSLKFSVFHYNKIYGRQLLSSGGYFQIARIANTVATNSDNLFISSYIGAGNVPMYSFTTKLAQILSITLASKIPNVVFAGVSEIIDKNEIEKLKNIFNLLMKILFRLALLTVAFAYFFNENFVVLWVGKHNYAGNMLNLVVCYWIVYEFVVRGTSSLVYAFGDFKSYAYVSVAEITGNIILSIILIQKFGLVGVALATAISRTLTTGVYLYSYFKKKGMLSVHLTKILIRVLMLSLPTIGFYFICKMYFINIGWSSLIIIGLGGAIINFLSFDLPVFINYRHEGLKSIFLKILFNL